MLARYGDADIEHLLADTRIVRNRRKIEAAIANARATADMHAAGEALADLVWAHRPSNRPAPRSWADSLVLGATSAFGLSARRRSTR